MQTILLIAIWYGYTGAITVALYILMPVHWLLMNMNHDVALFLKPGKSILYDKLFTHTHKHTHTHLY